MFKKIVTGVSLLLSAAASQASVVDYASLATAVQTELNSGVTAAMVGVGVIWGARIGLNFVRSIMR
jgi:hypothetical protein